MCVGEFDCVVFGDTLIIQSFTPACKGICSFFLQMVKRLTTKRPQIIPETPDFRKTPRDNYRLYYQVKKRPPLQAAFLQFSLNFRSYPQYSTWGGGASNFYKKVHLFPDWCTPAPGMGGGRGVPSQRPEQGGRPAGRPTPAPAEKGATATPAPGAGRAPARRKQAPPAPAEQGGRGGADDRQQRGPAAAAGAAPGSAEHRAAPRAASRGGPDGGPGGERARRPSGRSGAKGAAQPPASLPQTGVQGGAAQQAPLERRRPRQASRGREARAMAAGSTGQRRASAPPKGRGRRRRGAARLVSRAWLFRGSLCSIRCAAACGRLFMRSRAYSARVSRCLLNRSCAFWVSLCNLPMTQNFVKLHKPLFRIFSTFSAK